MLRRRILQTATGILLLGDTVSAQETENGCTYYEISDDQIDRMLADAENPLLSRIKSGEASLNYLYFTEGSILYDNGNVVDIEEVDIDDVYPYASQLITKLEESETYANNEEKIDCSQIPFSREPEANFEISSEDPADNSKIVLDAGSTESEIGSIQTFRWEVNGETLSETGEVVRTTLDSGLNTVTLTVVMESGITKTATETIEVASVANLSPSFNYDPTSPSTDDTVAFDASGTTAENTDIKAYEWDFDGDGTVDATGVNAVNKFEKGRHVVSLTVKDTQGNEETTEQILEVDARPVNVLITASDTEVEVGGETIIQYSVNNFLSSEELTTQLLVETPSDVNVTGVSGAQGSNQYTAEATVPPGEQQSMRVTIQINAVGQHEITAIAEYLTTGEQAIDERVSKELLMTAVDGTPEEESTVSTETEDDSPGFGIGSGLAAIGGAGYILKSQMKNNNQN
jgi:hypothetical protein